MVEQALAPTLAPGDLVIMDNLGAHRSCQCGRRGILAKLRPLLLGEFSTTLRMAA